MGDRQLRRVTSKLWGSHRLRTSSAGAGCVGDVGDIDGPATGPATLDSVFRSALAALSSTTWVLAVTTKAPVLGEVVQTLASGGDREREIMGGGVARSLSHSKEPNLKLEVLRKCDGAALAKHRTPQRKRQGSLGKCATTRVKRGVHDVCWKGGWSDGDLRDGALTHARGCSGRWGGEGARMWPCGLVCG